MNTDAPRSKNELYITKAWTISFLTLIALMIVIYVIRVSAKGISLKPFMELKQQDLLHISTLMPLFIYISSVLTEIGEGIIMIAQAIYNNWREKKEQERKKKEQEREKELEAARLEGAQEQYEAWIEWADNGRDKSTRPQPPKSPNSISPRKPLAG